MKLRKSTLFLFCLLSWQVYSQNVTETFSSRGNVYVQYGKMYFHQITKSGLDTLPILSKNKKFLIYLRCSYNNDINLSQIIRYDLKTSKEKILIQSAEDHPEVSTPISYAKSYEYYFSCLGDISNILLSPDNKRIYFEASAWAVSDAIHYYVFSTGKIYFYHSGDLIKIYPDGMLKIRLAPLAYDKKGNSYRYLQDWLFDKNGEQIRPLSKKY